MHNIAAKTCLFVSSLALLQERNCFLYGLVKPRFTRGDPVTLPGLRVIFDPSYAHPSKAVLTRGYTPVGTSLLAQEPPGGQLGHETMRVVDQISSDPVPVDDVLVRHEQSEQDSGIARQGQPAPLPRGVDDDVQVSRTGAVGQPSGHVPDSVTVILLELDVGATTVDAARDAAAPAGPGWSAPVAREPVSATVTVPGSKSLTNRALTPDVGAAEH